MECSKDGLEGQQINIPNRSANTSIMTVLESVIHYVAHTQKKVLYGYARAFSIISVSRQEGI